MSFFLFVALCGMIMVFLGAEKGDQWPQGPQQRILAMNVVKGGRTSLWLCNGRETFALPFFVNFHRIVFVGDRYLHMLTLSR